MGAESTVSKLEGKEWEFYALVFNKKREIVRETIRKYMKNSVLYTPILKFPVDFPSQEHVNGLCKELEGPLQGFKLIGEKRSFSSSSFGESWRKVLENMDEKNRPEFASRCLQKQMWSHFRIEQLARQYDSGILKGSEDPVKRAQALLARKDTELSIDDRDHLYRYLAIQGVEVVAKKDENKVLGVLKSVLEYSAKPALRLIQEILELLEWE